MEKRHDISETAEDGEKIVVTLRPCRTPKRTTMILSEKTADEWKRFCKRFPYKSAMNDLAIKTFMESVNAGRYEFKVVLAGDEKETQEDSNE